jgi:hypothetical protein
MELAMVRLWAQRLDAAGALVPPMGRCKAVYLAPIRCGCHPMRGAPRR